MEDVVKLFGVMLAIMIPVAVGGCVFFLVAGRLKGLKGRRAAGSSQELEELRARVRELEQRQAQLQELEERVDFFERMLPALREGKALPQARPRQ